MTSFRSSLLTGIACFGLCACSDDESPTPRRDAGATQSEESEEPSTRPDGGSSSASATTDSEASSIDAADTSVSSDASNSTVVEEAGVSETLPDAGVGTRDAASDGGAPTDPVDYDASDSNLDATTEVDANLEPADFMPPRGPCATADRVGRFIIESQEDFGVVQGTINDGVVPTSVPDVVLDDGTCRLDLRRTLSCVPACLAGETCGEGGECIPFPARLSVGEVEITGLTKPTHVLPQNPGAIYVASGADNPPYRPGSEVILTAAGSGDIPRFDLFGVGSTPLTQEPTWTIDQGEDLVVTWPSSGGNSQTSVLVELTVDQHGTSPLSLVCEFPDTGSASVPSDLIDQMLSAGVSGFPNGRITRRTADHVDVPIGCIELAVGSPRSASVNVSGHTPCQDDDACPDGQTCNIPIETCE